MTGARSFSLRSKKFLVPFLMLSVAVVALVALESTRGQADYDRNTFRPTPELSSESAVVVGGERPAQLILPTTYTEATPVPLLIDLHGFTGDGPSQSLFSFMQAAAEARGVAYVAPNGLLDSSGSRFWNASNACCNFGGSQISDVDYVETLIEEISSKAAIDPSRIYLFGHSNGHFMSYKFACSTEGVVAAISGLAGAMDNDPRSCNNKPMNVLHIHGTSDATISYEGGAILGNPYPSTEKSVAQWALVNSCTKPREREFELLSSMQGSETTQIAYTCAKKSLELWRINGGVHVPVLDKEFALKTLDWLLTHRK
jgi:polyhydroxybutyrate depolymerase